MKYEIKVALRFCVTNILLVGAVGCSSIADYRQPITDLSTSMDSSFEVLKQIDSEISAAKNEQLGSLLEENKALVITSDGTCSLGSNSCSLVVLTLGSDEEQKYPVRSMMPNAIAGLESLKQYTGNLKAIVDADTAASITTHVNSALASAGEIELALLSSDGENAVPSSIAAYKQPITNSFSWFASQYIERQKMLALAAATKRAQPAIVKLSNYFDTSAFVAASIKDAKAHSVFVEAQKKFDTADVKTKQVVKTYLEAVQKYDQSLKATSSQPMRAFLAAHSALTEALNGNDKISLADAISAIKAFQQHSKDFKGLLNQFVEVAKQESN